MAATQTLTLMVRGIALGQVERANARWLLTKEVAVAMLNGVAWATVVAVVAYAHVLLGEGFEAALGQHYLWGFMLLVVLVCGPGRLALDTWLKASGANPR